MPQLGRFMALVELQGSSFKQIVSGSPLVLIDFWAAWCGPCKRFGPIFEAAASHHPDITFAKVNTESEPDLAAELEITAIPTLMVFRDGIRVYSEAGALSASALDDLIQQAQRLDMDAVRKELAQRAS